jgi:hypothetical protein
MTSQTADQLAAAMCRELGALLDAVPASRRVMQHLAVLEQALKLHGLNGLTKLPEAVLVKAHGQLSKLPLTSAHQALPRLLSLLSVQEPPPSRDDTHPQQGSFVSSFLTEEKLQVSEGSLSDFVRLQGGDAPDKR